MVQILMGYFHTETHRNTKREVGEGEGEREGETDQDHLFYAYSSNLQKTWLTNLPTLTFHHIVSCKSDCVQTEEGRLCMAGGGR